MSWTNKQTNKQTNLSANSGVPQQSSRLNKVLKVFLILFLVGSGSALGGFLYHSFSSPKEACAACVALPTKGTALYACPTQTACGGQTWYCGTCPYAVSNFLTTSSSCTVACINTSNGDCELQKTLACPSAGYTVNF